MLSERAGLERLGIDQADWNRAMHVQHQLAVQSRHRATAIPGLLIAAVAERHAVTLLHYDHDSIAAVNDQATQRVVPAGSVP